VNDVVTYRDKTVPWVTDVVEVWRYDDDFVHIVSTMPANVAFSPGETIAIDVEPQRGTLRRYTVSKVSAHSFECIAFRTNRGPATPFLDQLKTGDQLSGLGPERPVKLPTPDMSHVVVMGDETVMGTAVAVAGAAIGDVSVAVKTSNHLTRISALVSSMSVNSLSLDAHSDDDAMMNWLSDVIHQHGVDHLGVFLVGEQSANQKLRQLAFAAGLPKEKLATRTFWRPDKSGLE